MIRKPRVSRETQEHAEEIIQTLSRKHEANTRDRMISFKGLRLLVKPSVFSPDLVKSTRIISAHLGVKKGSSVLDLGTGCGVLAILAARKAKKVTAADINENAVKSAIENVKIHGLRDKVRVIHSDLFQKIKGKFHTIIFNPPFYFSEPTNDFERSIMDKNYQTLALFLNHAKDHLLPGGKIVTLFSNAGDLKFIMGLIKKHAYKAKEVHCRKKGESVVSVYHLFPKLS